MSIENLRLIAALCVVLAHSPKTNFPVLNLFLGSNFFSGSIGVDIFFVISGYVIMQNIEKLEGGSRDAIIFMKRRIFRIAPVYWLITCISFGPLEWNLSYFVKSILLIPDKENNYNPAVSVGWTLQFEMFFYLVVAIGLLTSKRLAVILALISSSLISYLYFDFYFGAPIIIEFLFGIGIFYILKFKSKMSSNFNINLKYLYLFFSTFFILLTSTGRDFSSNVNQKSDIQRMSIFFGDIQMPRAIAWGLPSAFFVYSVLCLENEFKWKLSFLGKYTYSFYLWQEFPIPYTKEVIHFLGPIGILMYLFQLFVVSFFSYHLVEKIYINLSLKSDKLFK